MSLLTEVLDRLSGVAVVREKLEGLSERVTRLGDQMLDHERRLLRLEVGSVAPSLRKKKTLSKKRS